MGRDWLAWNVAPAYSVANQKRKNEEWGLENRKKEKEKKIDQSLLRLGSLAVQVFWMEGRAWLMEVENPDFINILKGSPFQLFISRDLATLPFFIRFHYSFILYKTKRVASCTLSRK